MHICFGGNFEWEIIRMHEFSSLLVTMGLKISAPQRLVLIDLGKAIICLLTVMMVYTLASPLYT